MKRGALMTILGLAAVLLLAACRPSAVVATQVVPTLISIQTRDAPTIVLQGRYLGGGGGDSYVLVGANVDAEGGVRVEAESWSPSRIVFEAPPEIADGFVFVFADGRRSNPLPPNLQ